jgi:hypothetical protein
MTMRNLIRVAAALLTIAPWVANAGPIIFVDDEAGFDSQTLLQSLGLAGTEDWESSSLAPNDLALVDDAINPGIANGPFATGTNVATGMTVQSNTNANGGADISPRGIDGLATLSDGLQGNLTDSLFANFEFDSLDLIFGTGALAISLTPLFLSSAFDDSSGNITIRVFDLTNTEISPAGGTIINTASFQTADSFYGIVAMAGQSIGRINLFDGNSNQHFQGVDNIDVYQAGGPGPTPVPAPGTLVLLGIGLAGMGLARRRKKV